MALTWRNVSAPNLPSPTQDLYYVNRMFSNALGDIGNSLDGIQNQRNQSNQAALIQRAMQFNNADDLNAAMQSGELYKGLNQSALSPEVLNQVSNRIGELQTQRYNRLRNDESEYTLNRTQAQNSALDQARPAVFAIQQAASQGNQEEVARLQQENADVLQKLTPDQINNLGKEWITQANTVDDQTNQQRQQDQTFKINNENLKQSRYRFNELVEAENNREQAQALIAQADQQISDTKSAEKFLSTIENPEVRNMVSGHLANKYPDLNATMKQRGAALVADGLLDEDPVYQTGVQASSILDQAANEATSRFPGLVQALSDTESSSLDVAQSIKSQYEDLDEPAGEIADIIQKIQTKLNVGPATAGIVLKNMTDGEGRPWWLFGDDIRIDDSRLNQLLKDNNVIVDAISQYNEALKKKSKIDTYLGRYAEAQGTYQANVNNIDRTNSEQLTTAGVKRNSVAEKLAKELGLE